MTERESAARTGRRVPGLFAGDKLRWAVMMVLACAGSAAPLTAQAQDAVLEAQRQVEAGDYAAAVNTLRGVAARNPRNAEAAFWLMRAYYETHEFDNAIAQGEHAIKLAPQNSSYHMWLGRAYGEKADREHSFGLARRVKHEFEEAVRLDPKNIQGRRDLSEFEADAPWIVGGSTDGARQQVEAIAALDPLAGHLARARLYAIQKKFDQAESEYRQVLQAAPREIEPYMEVAEFYQQRGRPAELRAAMEAAAKVAASDPRIGYFRAVAAILAGQEYAQAEQYLKSYLANTPERSEWPAHAAAREWLGRLYEAEGKRAEAAEQFRAAVQLEPARKTARDRLRKLGQDSK